MADNKGSSFADYLLTFMAGAATGFILGILFAPTSGKETRQKIKEQAKKDSSWQPKDTRRWPRKPRKAPKSPGKKPKKE